MRIISKVKIGAIAIAILMLVGCGGGGGTSGGGSVQDQTGFSLGSDTTVLRDSADFMRTASNSQVNDVLYTSSNTLVADIEMNTGLITTKGVGTTTIEASSNGDSNHNAASATFVLTVNQTMLQEWLGGVYLDESQEATSVAFNTGTGQMENGVGGSSCNFRVSNSIEVNQHKMETLGGVRYIVRCGQGSIYGDIPPKYDGQAIFIFSDDKKMIMGRSFAPVSDPSGAIGYSFPVWSNIPIGTTEVLKYPRDDGGADTQVTKSIYNGDGIYTFVDGNIFGVPTTTQATSCIQVHTVNQFGSNYFYTTVVCPGYGPVFFNTDG